MKSKLGALMLALLFGIVAAPVVYAQATGTLSGTVTDPNGAVRPEPKPETCTGMAAVWPAAIAI